MCIVMMFRLVSCSGVIILDKQSHLDRVSILQADRAFEISCGVNTAGAVPDPHVVNSLIRQIIPLMPSVVLEPAKAFFVFVRMMVVIL